MNSFLRILEQAEQLDAEEQRHLLADRTKLVQPGTRPRRSILELDGLGKEIQDAI